MAKFLGGEGERRERPFTKTPWPSLKRLSQGSQLKGSRVNGQNSLPLEAVGVAKSVQGGTKILCPPHPSPLPPLGGVGVLKQGLFFIPSPLSRRGFT